jgi:DNA-binding NarL/FixJ family response regulator
VPPEYAPRPQQNIPRVIVVDADERVRESLSGLLCIGDRLTVVGSAGETADALELAADQHPDIVVIDPRLSENDGGVAFIEQLREAVPGVRIIGMSRSDGEVDAALAACFDAFVRKTFRPNDLQSAILGTNGATAG